MSHSPNEEDWAIFPISRFENYRVRDAMRAVDAVGPAAAVRREELPEVVRAALEQYLYSGVIREGVPGTCYYYEAKVPLPTLRQLLSFVLFLVILIVIAFVIIQFSAGGPRVGSP